MSESTRSTGGLDVRRRRLLYRSWHRGTREMDLILGRFADAHMADLAEQELDDYEALLEVPDADLFAWLTGATPVTPRCDTALFRRLREFSLRTK
ncbi:MAG TPA: succinate dehydrogenase assembly factor 2 [Xanthobacteraceae bacterium]|jgi:antitoxin CptB|nr:succinate dehydrogenase assembly factor 2 [Xanthobacteraceae bacterium]